MVPLLSPSGVLVSKIDRQAHEGQRLIQSTCYPSIKLMCCDRAYGSQQARLVITSLSHYCLLLTPLQRKWLIIIGRSNDFKNKVRQVVIPNCSVTYSVAVADSTSSLVGVSKARVSVSTIIVDMFALATFPTAVTSIEMNMCKFTHLIRVRSLTTKHTIKKIISYTLSLCALTLLLLWLSRLLGCSLIILCIKGS